MTAEIIESTMSMQLAKELGVQPSQVIAAINLLDEGATIPFIARYRKEATQGLTDTHLRQLEERLEYLRDLTSQKETALRTIQELDKLTPELEQQIQQAETKQALADLYQPYRPKRKSKASQAIEAGLEPLAEKIWQDPTQDPMVLAETFLNPEHKVETPKAALEGARQILAERWSDRPEIIQELRQYFREEAHIISKGKKPPTDPAEKKKPAPKPVKSAVEGVVENTTESPAEGKEATGKPAESATTEPKAEIQQPKKSKKLEQFEKKAAKFADYVGRDEAIKTIASHRTLALFRGRREGVLDLEVNLPSLEKSEQHPCVGRVMKAIDFTPAGRAADEWLTNAVLWCWRVKLHTKIENDLLSEIKEKADLESIGVFAKNLKHLLMSAPAGDKPTLGLDPGLRTGVKVAVISNTGQVLGHTAIFPHVPKNQWDQSIETLKALCIKHDVELVAIGNGTASRETDKLASQLIRQNPELKLKKAVISEAGASIYSASEFASKELPNLDVSIRGAVSIARRLQDPLAELVKIEPKSIGVGQYQHDVSQPKLAKSLDSVVEDCVNAVGVDVNTASIPLLTKIAGLNETIAANIVRFRDENGPYTSRTSLKKVPRLGNRTFEQAAGFLRIANGENPLDQSAVHPESYPLVTSIAQTLELDVSALIGNTEALTKVQAEQFVTEQYGVITISDVIKELEKPGRDPRPEFTTVEFRDDVQEIKDLKADMVLDGIVTNVTNFGAFVDVGVHQDGLVHISALTDAFVSDPHLIVKAGDKVKVKVLAADTNRNRIDLTMRLNAQQSNTTGSTPNKENHGASSPSERRDPRPSQKAGQSRPSNNRSANHKHNHKGQGQGSQNKQNQVPAKPKMEKALPPGKTGTFADLFAGLKK